MQTFQQVEQAARAGDPKAQDLLAQVYEQSGRPQEALEWLAKAAKAGLPAAHARLGLWQLAGHGVPANPSEGVARIMAAAQANDPLGLSLAITVDAGGIGAARDPRRALQWLVRSAQGGDERAACQLGLLVGLGGAHDHLARAALTFAATGGFEPALKLLGGQLRAALAPDWIAIGQAVDLSPFTAPIHRRVERDDPAISTIESLIPGWACDYICALAEPSLQRGEVLTETGAEAVRSERSNRVMHFGLGDSDLILEMVNNRISEAAGMPAENGEALGVLHYAPGERYAPHVDYIPPTPENAAQLAARGQRVRTVLVYLNDGFEGGRTEFPRLDAAFRPPRGGALIFDSVLGDGAIDPRTLHTGAPPTSGEKWVISKWFRTRALRPAAG